MNEACKTTAGQQLEKISILSFEAVLAWFSFLDICSCVDHYLVSRFEPLHKLSFGISRLLKESMWNMLKDDRRIPYALKSRSSFCKTFKSVRMMILSTLNRFLYESHESLMSCDIWLNYRKWHQINYLDGFYSDAGVSRMLQASYYDAVDLVLPFFGALVDEFCGLYETAEVTKVFTQYIEMMFYILKVSGPRLVGRRSFQTGERYNHLQNIYMPDLQWILTIWNGHLEVACSRLHMWWNK